MRLVILVLCAIAASHLTAAERPNILVFLVDDMGLMDTSVPFLTDAEGQPERHPLNDFYRTPNMERLAKQGVRFSQFYAMSVCSPTRVSIMTGQTSARHHTTQFIKPESNNAGPYGPPDWSWEGISADQVTLPKLLEDAGYCAIHAGKAHFGPNDSLAEDPTNFGFTYNIAGCAYGQPGSYYGTENFGWGQKGREKRAVPDLEEFHGQDIYLTEALTLKMNKAIQSAVEADMPFFAYMSHYAVHAPFQADPRFVENYSDASKQMAAFGSMIEGMDKSLGDILDKLEELGVAENTLVFFLGDNGTDAPNGPTHEIACAAPLRGKKGTHYEGGMRVPFIAAWAKPDSSNEIQKKRPIAQGAIVDHVGAVYDLVPTILSVAQVEDPSLVLDGMDLGNVFTGLTKTASPDFLMHFPHSHRSSYFTAFRRGDWKLVYHYQDEKWGKTELFNLAEDRDESENLSKSEPTKLKEMMEAMNAALEETGAQYPLGEDKKTPVKPSL